jgi:hypothetical protein
VVAPAAAKTLRKLPRNERERILAAIERLPAGDVRSLRADRVSGVCASIIWWPPSLGRTYRFQSTRFVARVAAANSTLAYFWTYSTPNEASVWLDALRTCTPVGRALGLRLSGRSCYQFATGGSRTRPI